ncbi:MAG: VOC family protein [Caulobacteraceae bacterium]|nr:VOC family protein [Caulobacter sp.]RYF94581.1 MAG: VOC family protein [Caulobacteraceae bacterium]
MATARYLVRDVAEAVGFYTDVLGFEVRQRFGPAMAIVVRGDQDLWLAGPESSAGKALDSGAQPSPGGWNRIVLVVDDLAGMVARMAADGIVFRGAIVSGPGGSQALCEDPSGNAIELFQPGKGG